MYSNAGRSYRVKAQTTILIADDDEEIRNLLGIYLKNEGYTLYYAQNGKEVLEIIHQTDISLVILDLMMPVLDGISTCMEIRKKYFMPILMLTAKTSDLDLMKGITIGADDYMRKPFNPLEVTLRVKSLLRRYQDYGAREAMDASLLQYKDLSIDIQTRQCLKGGQSIRLTPKEFDILSFFMRNPNQVLSLDQIYEAVWQEAALGIENVVMVHITKLREKIEDDSRQPSYIKTVWGKGYRL
ncbi:response regulator transcription factor [Planococcus donghaensis]|uniref:DNA-binding response regulator n=1 Tax=Planococcus donghaensis TaxID=414778 RepID=A0A1C7EI72_9BACL|nr:response regulator transcription factor [Planococcus donghaensis]ANU23052.1 DNA-binding response regulator [Planococcus donghaensis]